MLAFLKLLTNRSIKLVIILGIAHKDVIKKVIEHDLLIQLTSKVLKSDKLNLRILLIV